MSLQITIYQSSFACLAFRRALPIVWDLEQIRRVCRRRHRRNRDQPNDDGPLRVKMKMAFWVVIPILISQNQTKFESDQEKMF